MIAVAALIAFAAAALLPSTRVLDESGVKRSAQLVAAALQHARDESIRTEQPHQFSLVSNTLSVRDTVYTSPANTIPQPNELVAHPSSRNPYAVALNQQPGTGGLASEATFVTSDGMVRATTMFDQNGVPKHIDATGTHVLTGGSVTLTIGARRYTVTLQPDTGRVNVTSN